MKLLSLKCPSCGGSLSVEEGREFTFCQFCGTKILLTDENKFTYRHIDDADIKRAETERIVQLKELELEKDKRSNRKILIFGWAVLSVLLFLSGIALMAIGNEGTQTAGAMALLVGMNVAGWGALFLFAPNKKKQDSNNSTSTVNIEDFPKRQTENTTANNTQVKGNDLKCHLILTSLEAVNGTTKSVQLQKNVICKACNGNGFQIIPSAGTCPTCKGFGKIPEQMQTLFGTTTVAKTCPICNGKETALKNPCGQCNGTGQIKSIKNIPVTIPAGTRNGAVLSVKGEGETGINGGPAGNLYIEIEVN